MRTPRKGRRAVRPWTAALAAAALGIGAFGALLAAGTADASSAPRTSAVSAANTTGAATTSGGLKVAYYDQWSVYQNAFYLKNVQDEGEAGKLNYLIYDFENIDPTNLTCFENTKASDPDPGGESDPNAGDGAEDAFADYQKSFGSDISVDGTADVYNQPIAGNFHQLQELKAKNPNLKVLLSIGGWTYSKYFSDVAATDASRKKFVSSCIDMFIKGNLPSQGGYGGTGSAAGIFDGFDIDWEYPGGGGHVGNHSSPSDKQDFTALLAEFRSELDAQGKADGKSYALSAALPAGQDKIADIETDKIGQYLTFGDPMTYDMHGGFEPTGPTNHASPIYDNPNDPSSPIAPGNEKYSDDEAIKAYTVGDSQYGIPGGFPASKLNFGVPFYYRGWTGVPAGNDHGLFQTATGPAAGSADSGSVPGVRMYKELTGVVDNPSDTFWDPVAQAAYFYDGTNFWTGEDAQSLQAKADYVHCNGLGGEFMFSLYDLDQAATLFNDTVNDVNGSAGTCTPGGSTTGGTTTGGSTTGGSTTGGSTTGGSTTGGTTTGGSTTGGSTTGGSTTGGSTTGGSTTGGSTTGGSTTGGSTGGTTGSGGVVNGGFESGALTPWTCSGGTGSVQKTTVHGGTYALAGAASSSDDAQCQQTISVKPNTKYTLSGYVDGSYVYLGDSGTGTTDTSTWASTGGSWQKLSTSFTTGANTTSVTIYVHGWYGQGTYYADDIGVA
ncbi:glycosyl hydrolase family 18 protein [Streptomyces sp. ICBB 8177]|uniref:glycosyl hydrolase family 18 protein n=1 Tax=Streptomyces sp. ICBB 8177 TaxID=563922 RepID=UPI000D676267|nr:glycosyl hydrolase family 18 protein [Streptomyces sp. ICBB 8177]PWI45400.1 glycoside hydrolase [Streptomyces sp. ICBB 8177]